MARVSVITGGTGGMGLATAKILGREDHILIADLNSQRLDAARDELQAMGIDCEAMVCDVTSRSDVDALLNRASELGRLGSVVHTAGISPQMADAETILRVNALGTINIAEACLEVASEGFVLVNVASMSAYMLPNMMIPKGAYKYAFSDPEKLLKKLLFRANLMRKDFYKRGFGYGISKHFVMWYTRKSAPLFGKKGARVLSISPGTYATEMGILEEKSGSMDVALKTAALKRAGKPEEIAELLAFCATEKAGYLTGVDILADGGVISGRER